MPLKELSRSPTQGLSSQIWPAPCSSVCPSLVAQTVKNLPAMQEIQVRSLVWEDPLEKGMAAHSSILAWRILWTEEPGGLQSMELQRVRHRLSDLTLAASLTLGYLTLSCIGQATLILPRSTLALGRKGLGSAGVVQPRGLKPAKR